MQTHFERPYQPAADDGLQKLPAHLANVTATIRASLAATAGGGAMGKPPVLKAPPVR